MNLGLVKVLDTARTYARNRLVDICGFNTRAKLGVRDIEKELVMASVFGELSCLERLTAILVSEKTLTREDIEAEIHLSIVDYYNFIKKEFGGKVKIDLDKYLQMRGYTGQSALSRIEGDEHGIQ